MVALASTTQGVQFHCYSNHQKDWWYIIVHPTPQSEDLLFELPKYTDPIQYQPPNKSFFLQSQPYFTHVGYDIPSCNLQNSSMILSLCIEAFTPHIEQVIQDYHLPLSSEIPDPDADLVCLVLVPWDHMVRTSYSIALARCHLDPSWRVPTLHNLIEHALPSQHDNYMHQLIDLLTGALHMDGHSYLIDEFSGTTPFTNNPLKKLASAGACFFDHVSFQMAVMLKIQTTTNQNLVAANTAECEICDTVLQHLPGDRPLSDKIDHCIRRHWNKKGNSMEALALLLAEDGHHVLIWIMAWICIQITTKESLMPL